MLKVPGKCWPGENFNHNNAHIFLAIQPQNYFILKNYPVTWRGGNHKKPLQGNKAQLFKNHLIFLSSGTWQFAEHTQAYATPNTTVWSQQCMQGSYRHNKYDM